MQYKVNDTVCLKSDESKVGVVKAKESVKDGNRVTINYLVDFGTPMTEWKILSRKDIKKVPAETLSKRKNDEFKFYYYEVNRAKVTCCARVQKSFSISKLTIGITVLNPNDYEDAEVAKKISRHRCIATPFTTMFSHYHGEFDENTVRAICAEKANLVASDIDRFGETIKKLHESMLKRKAACSVQPLDYCDDYYYSHEDDYDDYDYERFH